MEHLFFLTPERVGDPAKPVSHDQDIWSSEEWTISGIRLERALKRGAMVFFFENNEAIINKDFQMAGTLVNYEVVLDKYKKIYFKRDDSLKLDFFDPEKFKKGRSVVRWIAD